MYWTTINQHTHTGLLSINVHWTTINQCINIELLSINIHILNYYQSTYTGLLSINIYWTTINQRILDYYQSMYKYWTTINQHTHTELLSINVYWTTINQCILDYYQSTYTYWTTINQCIEHIVLHRSVVIASKARLWIESNWDFDMDDNDDNIHEHFWNVGSSCPSTPRLYQSQYEDSITDVSYNWAIISRETPPEAAVEVKNAAMHSAYPWWSTCK